MNLKNKYNQTIGWLLSYLLVFMIPFVVGCLIYFSAENIIKTDVYAINKYILNQIQNEFDDLTVDVYSLSKQIQTNRQILDISELDYISKNDRLTIIKTVDDLIKYKATSQVDDYFIYFGKSDSIIIYSGYFETDDIYNILPSQNEKDVEIWQKIKNGELNYKVFPFSQCYNKDENPCVTYCIPLNNADSFIVAQINSDRYVETINQLYHESIYFIFDNDNNVIFNSSNELKLDDVLSVLDNENGTVRINKDIYFVNVTMSNVNSIKYCGIIPKTVAYKNIIKTRWIMFIGFGLCLLIGFAFSLYFVKKNFKPIRDISKILISKRIINLNNINEESMLINVLNELIGSKISAEQKLEKQKNYVVSAATSMLLNNRFENDITREKFKQICEIDLSKKYYCVIVFNTFDNCDKSEINEYELQLFVIKNIFEEVIENKYIAYITDVNGVISGIINFDDISGYRNDLKRYVDFGSEALKKHFNLEIVVSSGGVKDDIKKLYESFNEAKSAFKHYSDKKKEDLIFFEQLNEDAGADYNALYLADSKDVGYFVSDNSSNVIKIMNDEDFVVKVLNIIHSEYYNLDLNVAYVAEKLSVSISYLSRTFSARMGEGILNYINKYRIEKSKEYLADKDLTLEGIIELVGFSSCNTYIRVFKKYTGVTPGKWRENIMFK